VASEEKEKEGEYARMSSRFDDDVTVVRDAAAE